MTKSQQLLESLSKIGGSRKKVNESTLSRLERFHGEKVEAGRNIIKGYPVDILPDSDTSVIEMDAVDIDAANMLAKVLRANGFKAKRVGKLGIVISESNLDTDLVDVISIEVVALIRLLEIAREDLESDTDLHKLVDLLVKSFDSITPINTSDIEAIEVVESI